MFFWQSGRRGLVATIVFAVPDYAHLFIGSHNRDLRSSERGSCISGLCILQCAVLGFLFLRLSPAINQDVRRSSTSDTFSSGNENASCVWQDARCPLWTMAEWARFWSSALLCKLSWSVKKALPFSSEGLREDELCAAVNDKCLWHITSCQSWLWLIKILSDHQFDAHPTVLIMTVYSLLNFYPTWISFTIYEQAEHTVPPNLQNTKSNTIERHTGA